MKNTTTTRSERDVRPGDGEDLFLERCLPYAAREPRALKGARSYVGEAYMNELFRRFSNFTSAVVGSPWAFILAVVVVVVWAFTGPMFGYSDTWQLVINTGTTIVTFLMVFLIQNTQNRDAKAIHLKLDELIRAVSGARNGMVDLENLTDEQLELLQQQFTKLREKHGPEIDVELETIKDELDDRVDDVDTEQERKNQRDAA